GHRRNSSDQPQQYELIESICNTASAKLDRRKTDIRYWNGISLGELMSSELIPAVSVIVPNYNHAPYLRRRIESILQQTYQDFELILLDDSSTDHSREILQSYAEKPGVKIAFNTMNSGSVFKQWNKGIR